ncbi:DUF4433 domain-containing protein [Rhodobacteraceae bacterium R_SAG5]|nr:DUF4433 domain-containing protein [Rhodobacteraceae bacterium R_SAG5]
MGISEARHQAHVTEWLKKFSNYKKKWPKNLFRHEPVQNAISILKSGTLVSRSDATERGILNLDIAPENIIQNRDEAHANVRLYFRPRTPTQFHIEGIRKPEDYYMGRHAGFLVMLVFDSQAILTMDSTKFSSCNMQSPYSEVLDGDWGFDTLDFNGIYHDQAYPTDDEKRKRCAEVLAKSPLYLDHTLEFIVVRTDADVVALKFLLIREGLAHLVPKIRKSYSTGVFFERYTAMDFVDTSPGRINFKLRGTYSSGDIKTELTVFDDTNHKQHILYSGNLSPLKKYYVEHQLPAGSYRILFELEDCFAHESLAALN